MQIIKHNKSFFITIFSLIVVVVLLFIATIFNILNLYTLKNQFSNLQSELQSLLHHNPSPIPKNIAITLTNLEQIQKIRDQWYPILGGFPRSKNSVECYLNIQKSIESIKAQAKAAQIPINPKCDFGFFQYLSNRKMPSFESLHGLDRQCRIIQTISTTLIQSNPQEILSFAREPIEGESALDTSLLNLTSSHRLHVHDIFYSNMFKIGFTGSTQTLRSFMNKIEHMQIPIFIRNLQVSKNLDTTHFSVTLELLDLK